MDSGEITKWLAYRQIRPLPDPYWCSALLASTVYNTSLVEGKRMTIEDFLPVVKSAAKQSTPADRAAARFKHLSNEAKKAQGINGGNRSNQPSAVSKN